MAALVLEKKPPCTNSRDCALQGKKSLVVLIYIRTGRSKHMKKMVGILMIVLSLGLFTACSSLATQDKVADNPLVGTWINVDTYLYEGKEETATNTMIVTSSTFIIDTVVIGEGYTEVTSENGTYTFTEDTMTMTLASHTDVEGITYDADALLDKGLVESLVFSNTYTLTESDGVVILTIEGSQKFIKQ
jgi:hypothetical protein